MSRDLETKIRINADASRAKNEVARFHSAFNNSMRDMGKTTEEIRAFKSLANEIRKGAKSVDELDGEMRDLYATYDSLRTIAEARHTLDIIPHSKITSEINSIKDAYEKLKRSGKLTGAELSQAALKTQEKINQLKEGTNGWVHAMETAKGSLASLAASGAGLTLAAKQAIDFESAMADVAKVVNGSADDVGRLSGQIKDLSTELPISAEGLAQIAAQGGQLGVPLEKLSEFTELAAKMGIAFGLSAEQAGEAVAKLSNVFGLPMEGVEQLGDAINTLGNNTAATESKILEALGRIGGTSKQFGLAADQAAALSAAMIALGKSPEVAATGINALLSKLQTANVQGPAFQDALAGIGLSAQQLASDIAADPQAALTDFLATLQKLDAQSRAETLTRLFGQEYQDDISLLVGSLDQYAKALDLVAGKQGDVAGAMDKEFRARMETTENQIKLLKNAVDNLGTNIGSILLPAIRGGAEALSGMTNAMADFAEQHPAVTGVVTGLVTIGASLGALRVAWFAMSLAAKKSMATVVADLTALRGGVAATALSVKTLGRAIQGIGWLAVAGEIASVAVAMGELYAQEKKSADASDALSEKKAKLADTLAKVSAETGVAIADMDEFNRLVADGTLVYDEAAQAWVRMTEQMRSQSAAEKAAADQAKLAAQNTADFMKAMEGLGVKSADAIGAAGAAAVDQFRLIAVSAQASGTDIGNAFEKALEQASSGDQLNSLGRALQAAWVTGKIGADLYQSGLDGIERRHLDLQSGLTGGLSEAFKHFGLTGAAELQLIADKSLAMYGVLEQSGQATAQQLGAAWLKYADDAIRANGGVASAALLAEANTRGLEAAVHALQQGSGGAAGAQDKLNAALAKSAAGDAIGAFQVLGEQYRNGEISLKDYSSAVNRVTEDQKQLREQLKGTGTDLKETVTGYQDIREAIGSADTVQELNNLKGVIENAFAAGRISASEYESALQSVEDKTRELTGVTRSLSVDMKAFAQSQGLAADQAERFGQIYQHLMTETMNQSRLNSIGGSIKGWFDALRDVERTALDTARRVGELDRHLAGLGSSGKDGVRDLQMRLLELNGTEEEIAQARAAREREQLELEIKRMSLELQKQAALGNTDEANAARTELKYLKEQLVLLDQIHRAEARKRTDDARNNSSTSTQQQTQPIKTVNVDINTPSGKRRVQTVNGSEGDLLDALAFARSVS